MKENFVISSVLIFSMFTFLHITASLHPLEEALDTLGTVEVFEKDCSGHIKKQTTYLNGNKTKEVIYSSNGKIINSYIDGDATDSIFVKNNTYLPEVKRWEMRNGRI